MRSCISASELSATATLATVATLPQAGTETVASVATVAAPEVPTSDLELDSVPPGEWDEEDRHAEWNAPP